MDRRVLMSPESAQASDIFDKFCTATTLKGILNHYRQLCNVLKLKPTHFPEFYPRIRQKLCSWRAQGLWAKFEKRASNKCYARGQACAGSRVLIIGGGPCGLRTAIEAQLLGAKVVLIEKRDRFSRNNVLHLWPFVITDLKALGAKKFYGKFCAGSIDHISIRQLQCILLKVALLLGVEVHEGVGFEGLQEPTDEEGWRAVTSPPDHPVSQYNFNCLIGADGRRNTLDGFKRKALRAKLAIAITANFINKRTEAEARVKEISGVSYIFNQKFFQDLNEATGIDLENIVYYKDETHYFVMTAKKQSLLSKGVLLNDHADTAKLLSKENISTEALMIYALEAAVFSTENQLPHLEFAVNHYGQPDVAMFDFTAMYAAENASRMVSRHGHKLMMTLVGDSLLEPFWPTGSGCARGFLSSFDACWMLRGLSRGMRTTLEVIAERESLYRLLGQTTPENLNKEHDNYTIDPHTRYPNLSQKVVMPFQVLSLYDTDEQFPEGFDGTPEQLLDGTGRLTKKRRRDAVVPVDTLLTWLRDQVGGYGLEVNSVTEVFIRGDILCAIIHRFRPDLMEFPPISEENMDPLEIVAQRNELAFDFLHKEYGIVPAMSGIESAHVNMSDFHTLVTYLSQLYDSFKGEIPQVKYPRVDGGDEVDEPSCKSSHVKYGRPSLVVKPGPSVRTVRRSRVSTARDAEHTDVRRHKKSRRTELHGPRVNVEEREKRQDEIEKNRLERQRRRIQDRILQTERFIKSMRMLQMNDRGQVNTPENDDAFEDYTFHLYRQMAPDFDERCKALEHKLFFSGREIRTSVSGNHEAEKVRVSGLTKNLEEKLRGSRTSEKKPKDLIRAIGKIEKSDWNVQLLEKKIAENLTPDQSKKEHDKVPKWSREAYDDKREAMKRKMEGVSEKSLNEKEKLFEETVKKLGNKLKEGNALEVGQRGCNKVSQMAEKLSHKYDTPTKEFETKQLATRPIFELPTKGGSELCHFCNQRVYVVERMTTEGKYFHRNCFRCEYCNTSLRLGNYVFDRDGRYGERFYCAPHYQTIKLHGWKKYDQQNASFKSGEDKLESEGRSSFIIPTTHQILSEMDNRGTTPERVEFENSVDFASEEELLSEMDEDEWTDRNFGASKIESSNTSDEASDISEDDELTPDGNTAENNEVHGQDTKHARDKDDSSDSDTEIASGTVSGSEEGASSNDLGEDDCEEDEDECEGSTTEVETDSEFAEDPPNLIPAKIPTIVVEEHEKQMAELVQTGHRHTNMAQKTSSSKPARPNHEDVYGELPSVEPVLRSDLPKGRALPKVYSAPKRWEPLASLDSQPDGNYSSELKKKYLESATVQPKVSGTKKYSDPATQNKFSSLLDMISEKQKLLQPASEPSPTMQAFLDGAEKLKNKAGLTGLRCFDTSTPIETKQVPLTPSPSDLLMLSKAEEETISMNLRNLEMSMEHSSGSMEGNEKSDEGKEAYALDSDADSKSPVHLGNVADSNIELMLISSDNLSSQSQSKTESQCTIKEADLSIRGSYLSDEVHSESGSELESGSCVEEVSDTDEAEQPPVAHYPPRVEIEDEFGVSLSLDEDKLVGSKKAETTNVPAVHPSLVCTVSSSDSKESLNSGAFLETELSEWSRETNHQVGNQEKLSNESIAHLSQTQGNSTKAPLALHLDSLDFADTESDSPSALEDLPEFQDYAHTTAKESVLKTHDSKQELDPEINPATCGKEDITSAVIRKAVAPTLVEAVNVAAIAPRLAKDKEKIAMLDRVVPFSKARDSLDYRKMRNPTNSSKVTSARNYKHLSSSKSVEMRDAPTASDHFRGHKTLPKDNLESVSSSTNENATIISRSPVTARRLEQINKERSKQNDLIKSMVMDRIRRSPEKNKRGSRGSLTIGSTEFLARSDKSSAALNYESGSATSISSVSDDPISQKSDVSLDVDPVVSNSNCGHDSNGRRASQETTTKFSNIRAEADMDDSFDLAIRSIRDAQRKTPYFDSPSGDYAAQVSNFQTPPLQPTNSTPDASVKKFPPNGIGELEMSPFQFLIPMESSICSAETPPLQERLDDGVNTTNVLLQSLKIVDQDQKTTTPGAVKMIPENGKDDLFSPSFYRSMPDLSNSAKEEEIISKYKAGIEVSCTSQTGKAKAAQRSISLVGHERAREEARERARLKTDEELGIKLSGNFDNIKDFGRRKLSFAEDEVFNPDAAITARVYPRREIASNTASLAASQCSYSIGKFDGVDNIAASIRTNVDFPVKKNPFLVSSTETDPRQMKQDQTPNSATTKDDFVQLNLHVAPKPTKELSKPTGSLPLNKFPTFFSAPRANWNEENIEHDRRNTQKTHTRSHTVTGIKLESAPAPGMVGCANDMITSTKGPNDGMYRSQGHNATHVLPFSPQFNTNPSASRAANKTKALSTETLLDNAKFTLAPSGESFRGVSVPDVNHDFAPAETQPKRSKDRTRRRSLIQAVSDFFSTKSPSTTKSPTGETDKYSSTSSPSNSTSRDNKFSIFKLTPKLLQKERLSSSPDSGLLRNTAQASEKTKPSKNPRASFMSYLSQPEILVQRLSNSPLASTSSRGASGSGMQTSGNSKGSNTNVRQGKAKLDVSSAEKQRNNELMEIQLQMESVETEQRQLECRGVSIERKLRGEEDDEGQDHAQLMEEWFTLVREKIRLSRYEKELLVRARELELDFKEESLEDELETSLLVDECEKSPEHKSREAGLFQELNEIKRQREALLAAFHEEMLKYEREDAELEARCSTLNPRESNV